MRLSVLVILMVVLLGCDDIGNPVSSGSDPTISTPADPTSSAPDIPIGLSESESAPADSVGTYWVD